MGLGAIRQPSDSECWCLGAAVDEGGSSNNTWHVLTGLLCRAGTSGEVRNRAGAVLNAERVLWEHPKGNLRAEG